MVLSVGKCPSIAGGHYTPETERGAPHPSCNGLATRALSSIMNDVGQYHRPSQLFNGNSVLCTSFLHKGMTSDQTRPLQIVGKLHKAGGQGDFICITRGVSHCGLAIYIKKYLKAKLFHHAKI